MFKQLFKKYFLDTSKITIICALIILVFVADLAFYLAMDTKMALYIMLAFLIFLLLGNWVSNVMVPRSRLRKKVPVQYEELAKRHKKQQISSKEIAELDYYARGLSFILWLLIPITITVIMTLI